MSLTVSYKGTDLIDETADCTKVMKTQGKYLEDDITIDYTGGTAPTLISKSITANGTYNASSDNADGYSSVTVNVVDELFAAIMDRSISGEVITDEIKVILSDTFTRTSITGFIQKSETKLGPYTNRHAVNAFYHCYSLKYIITPYVNTVTNASVGNGFCGDCPNLKLVIMNSWGTNSQGSAFASSSNIKSFVMFSDTKVSMGNSNIFNNSGISAGTGYIYVPDALVDEYKIASNWSVYASQIKGFAEADAYSSGTTYSVGDVVKHNNKFYAWINLTDGNTEPTGAVDSYGDWYCVADIATS